MTQIVSRQPFRAFSQYVALPLDIDQQAQVIRARRICLAQVLPFVNAKGLHDLIQIKQAFFLRFLRIVKLVIMHALSLQASLDLRGQVLTLAPLIPGPIVVGQFGIAQHCQAKKDRCGSDATITVSHDLLLR